MLLFEIDPVSRKELFGVEIFNEFFIQFSRDYYIPLFYIKEIFSKIVKNSTMFDKVIVSGLREYYNKQLYNNIVSIKYVDKFVNYPLSDYLILRGLVWKNNDLIPSGVLNRVNLFDHYFIGVDTIMYMFKQYKNKVPSIYGSLMNSLFHSSGIVPLNNFSQSRLLRVIENLMYDDFIIDSKDGLLKINDDILVDIESLSPTNNTLFLFVFPYIYIRGQLDYNTGIVNKYEFIHGKRRSYFRLVDSRLVNGSFSVGSKKVGMTKVKEFNSVSSVVNSINYFVSKGVIKTHVVPLYNDGKVYLFIEAKKGDWVSVIRNTKPKVTVDRGACSKGMGGFVRVNIGNKQVASFYSLAIAGVINPDIRITDYGELCGSRVYDIVI